MREDAAALVEPRGSLAVLHEKAAKLDALPPALDPDAKEEEEEEDTRSDEEKAADAAALKAKAAKEKEAVKADEIQARRDRRTMDAVAAEYKIDADAFDTADLRVEILKAAKVAVPRRDGLDEAIAAEVAYSIFLSARTARQDTDDVDPIRDAFRVDANPARQDAPQTVNLRDVYAPK